MVTDNPYGKIVPLKIEDEMRTSYLDYAMSVIVSRALPDVRDGLKPVQRRVLYGMHDLGLRPNGAHKKSAKIVGDVMGRFHPHGDASIYDTLVRMAQPFSLRYPLVDGQGNFGSVDADPPASMRYTEAKLAAIAEELLVDIDKETVDFLPNYDGSETQPAVLPARLPNLLVNGAAGIAVGMATNIPPHNITEICDAVIRLVEKPESTADDILQIVKGPDFPTAGIIIGREGIKNAYTTGQGRIVVRARTSIEETSRGDRLRIVVHELPYQVNKAALVGKIAELVKDKRVEGITDLRDESNRDGMRMVIELGRGAQPKTVLNTLYKHTALQSSFSVHMLCLVDNQPKTVNLITALKLYIDHRRDVIRRRSEYELGKAREREHVLAGLVRAIDIIDEIIAHIRASASTARAREGLTQAPFEFSERQAQAIVEMQLGRLAALERQRLVSELEEVRKTIAYLEDLLANPHKVDLLIRDDAQDLKKKFGDERRTQIVAQELENFSDEDLIANETVVVTLSQRGYIKRIPLDTYRAKRRGGKGLNGMSLRDDDAVRRLIVANTHDSLLMFTDRGRVFAMKVHEVTDAGRIAKGTPLINIVDIQQGELVTAMVVTGSFETDNLVLGTKKGEVKRTRMQEFAQIRKNGLIAMNLEDGDELISVRQAANDADLLMVSSGGQCIRFSVSDLRLASRASGGVRGMRVPKGEHVVAMDVVTPRAELLVISSNGYGKRTKLGEYPQHSRGGGGVRTFNVNAKTGPLVAAQVVAGSQDLMLVSREGIVMRTTVESIRHTGRSASGVSVMTTREGDAVASIATIDMSGKDGDAVPARAGRAARSTTIQTIAAQAAASIDGAVNGERPKPGRNGRNGTSA